MLRFVSMRPILSLYPQRLGEVRGPGEELLNEGVEGLGVDGVENDGRCGVGVDGLFCAAPNPVAFCVGFEVSLALNPAAVPLSFRLLVVGCGFAAWNPLGTLLACF